MTLLRILGNGQKSTEEHQDTRRLYLCRTSLTLPLRKMRTLANPFCKSFLNFSMKSYRGGWNGADVKRLLYDSIMPTIGGALQRCRPFLRLRLDGGAAVKRQLYGSLMPMIGGPQ